jgi:trehalose/maltose hydrolase-like predicted phosphorylase
LVLPPRTYVAGLFDTIGPEAPIEALVPAANWLQLHVTTNIDALNHDASKPSPHRLVLDMKRGMLLMDARQPIGSALEFHVRTLHLVSLSSRAIGLQLIEIRIEKGEVDITLEASAGESDLGLVAERLEESSGVWHTKEFGHRLGMALATSLNIDGADLTPASVGELSSTWHWTARSGQVVFFERAVALARTKIAGHDVRHDVQSELDAARRLGRRGILVEHEAAWALRWHDSDVVVEGDADAQTALRFAIYHLISAADPTDDHVSIGARALTGEDYHGHVFWDTEIYLVPFYIMTWPEAARALLMYRFHTLDGARAKAARMGWRGALYAWESADSGDETAPDHVIGSDSKVIAVLSGQQEQHISADVAFAIWQYWQATRDEGFLLGAGAEILLETGRFWASRAVLEADGKRHIRGVIGPDEYHEHIDDSAFTNVMARWNIRRALDVAALLRDRWPERWSDLSLRIGLAASELEQWRDAVETIVTGLDEKTGLFEQFAGYFDLEDIDLAAYEGRSVPMDVVLGRERTQRSQVVKQADVVALLALLPEEFPGASAAANFRYYEPRCGHGSSLSRAMHALVAARLGDCDMALRYFEDTAAIDLSDTHAASGGGIHIAAQGGIWLTAVFGFSGLSLRDDGVGLDPHIPAGWTRLSYRVRWRRRRLRIDIDPASHVVEAMLEEGEPMQLYVRDVRQELHAREPLRVSIAPAPG